MSTRSSSTPTATCALLEAPPTSSTNLTLPTFPFRTTGALDARSVWRPHVRSALLAAVIVISDRCPVRNLQPDAPVLTSGRRNTPASRYKLDLCRTRIDEDRPEPNATRARSNAV